MIPSSSARHCRFSLLWYYGMVLLTLITPFHQQVQNKPFQKNGEASGGNNNEWVCSRGFFTGGDSPGSEQWGDTHWREASASNENLFQCAKVQLNA